MKRRIEITMCVLILSMLGASSMAQADVADNYPWMYGQSYYTGDLRVAFLNSGSGTVGWGMDQISSMSDVDYYMMTCGHGHVETVGINYTHSQGDLDIKAYTMNGTYIGQSIDTSGTERIDVDSYNRGSIVMQIFPYQYTNLQSGIYTVYIECSQ